MTLQVSGRPDGLRNFFVEVIAINLWHLERTRRDAQLALDHQCGKSATIKAFVLRMSDFG